MEEKERESIQANLPDLLKTTYCSSMFLAHFTSASVLSAEECQEIENLGKYESNVSQAKKFYDKIITRSQAYDVLLAALQDTCQSGALALLDRELSKKFRKVSKFVSSPGFVDEFLVTEQANVLIVTSTCPELTCERIIETTKSVELDNINSLLEKVAKSPDDRIAPILVVKTNEDLDLALTLLEKITAKVIFIRKHAHTTAHTQLSIDTTQKSNIIGQTDVFSWKHLSAISQQKIFEFACKCLKVDSNLVEEILPSIESDVLELLIQEQIPTLLKPTIPKPLWYYVARKLVPRNIISTNIFKNKSADIFLIYGIRRAELSIYAPNNDRSTNVMTRCPIKLPRFIVLDVESHAIKLFDMTSSTPVHYLQWKQDKLIWIRSKGSVAILQQNLEQSLEPTREDSFIEYILSKSDNAPVCISDTPGMGKSILLGNIARELQKKYSSEIVAFIVISEWIHLVKTLYSCKADDSYKAVCKLVSANCLGEVYLNNSPMLKFVLLDGLDELDNSDIPFFYNCVIQFRKRCPNCKIFVTTRPHLLLELEINLEVLGYHILPLDEEDQLNFFKRFWSIGNGTKREKDFTCFIKQILTNVKSQLKSTENDIAGIPLQCLLIGEVFKEAAIDFQMDSDLDKLQQAELTFNIHSVVDLYKALIEKKFAIFSNRYRRDDDRLVWNMEKFQRCHEYLAIMLLFPQHEDSLRGKLLPRRVVLAELLDAGIVESVSVRPTPRFIHRTFAEYFISVYLVADLEISTSNSALLFLDVLSPLAAPPPLSYYGKLIHETSYQFKQNVICRFMETLIARQIHYTTNALVNISKQFPSLLPTSTLSYISEACSYSNCMSLFTKCILPVITSNNLEQKIFTDKLIIFATLGGSAEHVDIFYQSPFIARRMLESFPRAESLLHLAVARGNFTISQKLLMQHDFDRMLQKPSSRFANLIHTCVTNSDRQDVGTIKDKCDIIELLSIRYKWLLTSKDFEESLPLECNNIHVMLLKCLLTQSKDTLSLEGVKGVVFESQYYASSVDYLDILRQLHETFGLFRTCLSSSHHGISFINSLLQNMEPSIELLEFLNDFDILLEAIDFERSPIRTAILHKRSEICFQWLVGKTELSTEFIKQVLYYSTVKKCYRGCPAILSKYKPNLNVVNENRLTPLYFLLLNNRNNVDALNAAKVLMINGAHILCSNEQNPPITPLLCWKCTAVNLEILTLAYDLNQMSKKESSFYKFKWYLNNEPEDPLDSQEIFRSLTEEMKDFSVTDKNGDSLLHLAVKGDCFHAFKYLVDRHLVKTDLLNMEGRKAIEYVERSHAIEWYECCFQQNTEPFKINQESECWLEIICKRFPETDSELIVQLLEKEHNQNPTNIVKYLYYPIKYCSLSQIKKVYAWHLSKTGRKIESLNIDGIDTGVLDVVIPRFDGSILNFFVKEQTCLVASQSTLSVALQNAVQWETWIEMRDQDLFLHHIKSFYPACVEPNTVTGLTVLMIENIHPDAVKPLVELGVDVNEVDCDGNTALHWAIKHGSTSDGRLVSSLIKCGADSNAVNKGGESPLSICLKRFRGQKMYSYVIALLEGNADPTECKLLETLPMQSTGLDILTCSKYYYNVVKVLDENGLMFMFEVANENGVTPIQLAKQRLPIDTNTVNLLLKHDICPDI